MSDIKKIIHKSTEFTLEDGTARSSASTAASTATWGSLSGTISDQADLTTYINSLIAQGVSGMLGRMNFNGGVTFTLSGGGYNTSGSSYTCPSDGYILCYGDATDDAISLGGQTLPCYTNGYGVPLVLPVSAGDVVSYGGGGANTHNVRCVFFPQK